MLRSTRAPNISSAKKTARVHTTTLQLNQITSLFVADERKPAGILHIHDCLRAGIA